MSVWQEKECRYTQVRCTPPFIEPSATELYYTMSIWYVAECRCTQVRTFCHNTHVNLLKCFHVTTQNNWWSHVEWYVQDLSEIIWWIIFISMKIGHVSIYCSQHMMQVLNCSVAQNVHIGLSLCQQRKLLCIYVLLNTWCRWWIIMDITLCAAFSTDGTTLCCMHTSSSWQSTLKNTHVVNTCPYDDFYYDLILAYSIYVNQILSLTTLMIIVHGF